MNDLRIGYDNQVWQWTDEGQKLVAPGNAVHELPVREDESTQMRWARIVSQIIVKTVPKTNVRRVRWPSQTKKSAT